MQEKSYAFEYGVSDPHTGDHKQQWETKDKEGTVRGSYSLLEPDGTTRIVDYIADEHGFRAVVKKVGIHGTTVETHGGAEEHATPEVKIQYYNIGIYIINFYNLFQISIAAPVAHIEPQPTIIEEPFSYKSYDGGYEDYSDLKPVVGDVYTKPIEYIQAPKAELIINVPEQYEGHTSSYSHDTPLYPKAEGLKIALPQEYWSPEYIAQESYVLPQEKYVLPQEKYVLPQEKYVLPQQSYVLPAEYSLPAPKKIQEYVVPDYKIPQEYRAPVPAPVPEYKQAPIVYQVPQLAKEYLPSEKAAYSYVQEQRYNTPKGHAVIVQAPKVAYVEAPKVSYIEAPKVAYVEQPKQEYWSAPASAVLPSSHAQYNLNVEYPHY